MSKVSADAEADLCTRVCVLLLRSVGLVMGSTTAGGFLA